MGTPILTGAQYSGDKIMRMTYYGGKELAASFRTVRNNTIQIAEEIDEKNYGFQATPATRTVAQTLVHIDATTVFPLIVHRDHKLTTMQGFNFMAVLGPVMAEEQKPHTKAEIIAKLKKSRDEFGSWLESLPESFLAESVQQPEGQDAATKSRFQMILGQKEHEMHHRGQLMLLERMLGGVPHMTRHMQERMAQMQAAAAQK
jgi:uncharacterized damage-inducible protein DinB